jgi:hypothetical protein
LSEAVLGATSVLEANEEDMLETEDEFDDEAVKADVDDSLDLLLLFLGSPAGNGSPGSEVVSNTSIDSVSELSRGVSSLCSRYEVSSVLEMSSLTSEWLSSDFCLIRTTGLFLTAAVVDVLGGGGGGGNRFV